MACGILVPWSGTERMSPAMADRFLTNGPTVKCVSSCKHYLTIMIWDDMEIRHRRIYDPVVAAAKLLQSCPTLCDPTDGSPPGSPIAGILQARTLEWVAISFSNDSSIKQRIGPFKFCNTSIVLCSNDLWKSHIRLTLIILFQEECWGEFLICQRFKLQ